MNNKNKYLESTEIEKKLTEQLFEHREKLKMTQPQVAAAVGCGASTYQRWESEGINDIFKLLKVFQVLKFTTLEIIELLGLPLLNNSEIEILCQDEDTKKSIKEKGLYRHLSTDVGKIDDVTITKLINVLSTEQYKRLSPRRR